jgi:hypothetical protein
MAASPSQVPLPIRVAARPRDERGYPVPAITPWKDGKPAFAQQNAFRTLICLAERRCTVCGTMMLPGRVYRVMADGLRNIALALDTGMPYINTAPANEGPGHLTCMLYSAVVCPYLSSPAARRQIATTIGKEHIPRGDQRGTEAAVVGFDSYRWQVGAGTGGIQIFFGQPTEMLSYADGNDLAAELTAEVASEQKPAERCPAYLLDDDAKAEKAAMSIITRRISSPSTAVLREERARRNRRKAAKTARRKSR